MKTRLRRAQMRHNQLTSITGGTDEHDHDFYNDLRVATRTPVALSGQRPLAASGEPRWLHGPIQDHTIYGPALERSGT